MTDVITFDKQTEWEDFATDVHGKSGLNVMVSASQADSVPTASVGENTSYVLNYKDVSATSDKIVLDILIKPIDLAEGETSAFTEETLDAAVRAVVAQCQARAKEDACHVTGNFLNTDHKVNGALLRIYRDQDWPCHGHPEVLRGPIGMYHCDYCGQMQVAGTFHLTKEQTDV